MNELKLTDEEKKDLVCGVSELCEQGVLNKADSAEILGICKTACERRAEEIDRMIGKPVGIIQ